MDDSGPSAAFKKGVADGKLAKRYQLVIPAPKSLSRPGLRDYMRGFMAELEFGKA